MEIKTRIDDISENSVINGVQRGKKSGKSQLKNGRNMEKG